MVVAFFACWLPYTALSLVVVIDPELHIPPLVATMPMYFAKTSPIYNPIIYFLSNKQVKAHRYCRTEIKSWLWTKIEETLFVKLLLMYFLTVLVLGWVFFPISSVIVLWRCCLAAVTFLMGPPVSASACTLWTRGAGCPPLAEASTHTARCCLCDKKKLSWLSAFTGASSRRQTRTPTDSSLSQRYQRC